MGPRCVLVRLFLSAISDVPSSGGSDMRRFALVCCTILLTHGLLGAERTADAAPLISVTYDITGGQFGNLYEDFGYTGPITGVAVTYTPPGGPVSTPFTCTRAYACGRLDFLQSGPSLKGTPTFDWTVSTVMITQNRFYAKLHTHYTYYFPTFPTSVSIFALLSANRTPPPSLVTGVGHSGYQAVLTPGMLTPYPGTTIGTFYTIGNEVLVPEPPTHIALASSLVLLGTLAALRTRRRARLHWSATGSRAPQRAR
jgi:hypothetical protein